MIHNMIVKPANFDPNKKYPLFAVIHGGAANMWRDQFVLRWNYHLLAQPGYVVLLTDYKGSTGYGEEFARAIQGDPLKGPGDEVNEAVDEAVKKYSYVDGSKLAAGGASYGGHLANWLQATTTRYKAIVSHAGEMDRSCNGAPATACGAARSTAAARSGATKPCGANKARAARRQPRQRHGFTPRS
jgi:dipeptidyl aminopeptidase/acylaminoacyl peptidase